MDQRQRLDRKAKLGGSKGDVDGAKGVAMWKGMQTQRGLRAGISHQQPLTLEN